ncbi:MAG: yhdN 3, partial [Nocardioidaceae bacterium]|nr:yhdN 3 [Nocardioidaceae bacterium]
AHMSILTDAFPLALGGNPFGWTSDEATSHAVLDAFVDGGGQVVDTSDSYGAGASESIIGSWLASTGRREDVVLASKVSRHPDRRGLAPDTVRLAVDEQLARLRTDHLDVLWAHYDDADTPLEETLATFDELVTAGEVRELGISNYEPARITEWLTLAEQNGWRAPIALQPEYSLLRRHAFEDQRQALAVEHHLAVLPYWGLASGLLTGKYHSLDDLGQASDERRGSIVERYASTAAFAVVDVLREVAAAHDAEPATVALAWLLGRPGITAPIASVSRVAQLPALLAVPALELTDDETTRLTAASDTVGE